MLANFTKITYVNILNHTKTNYLSVLNSLATIFHIIHSYTDPTFMFICVKEIENSLYLDPNDYEE